jgi:peptidoglycan/xylan/chitin deacetylase (PgdA/CDA1 family)
MLTQTKRYDFLPIIDRTPLRLPGNARVAVVVYVNIEHFPEDKSGPAILPQTAQFNPDPLNYGWRDYGQRVGIWRLMEAMDRYDLRASACLNSDVCREYPRIIEEGQKRQWEWMGHGRNNTEVLNGLSESDERKLVSETLSVIENITGAKPKGWLSPFITQTHATADILASAGIEYLCDFSCDDLPFPLKVKQGSLLAMPYSVECNDLPSLLSLGTSPEDFGQLIRDQFDVLYEEGTNVPRVLPIALHTFIIGQAFRLKHLMAAFAHITSHSDVWLATAAEINDWYRGSLEIG